MSSRPRWRRLDRRRLGARWRQPGVATARGGMGKEELAVVRKEKLAGCGEDELAGMGKDELVGGQMCAGKRCERGELTTRLRWTEWYGTKKIRTPVVYSESSANWTINP
uniref:Uncharacterized protein n=1 Tax=Oryza rufipogon TaxID=4529 RepID=A0A0E0R0M8_ORYRU